MENVIMVGNLSVRMDIILYLLSMLSGWVVLVIRYRNFKDTSPMLDALGNAAVMVFLVWKLSVLLFEPILTLRNPISLLFYDGGEKGGWMGIAAGVAYYLHRKRKETISAAVWIQGVVLGSAAAASTYTALQFFLWDSTLVNGLLALGLLGVVLRLLRGTYTVRSLMDLVMWSCIGVTTLLFMEQDRYRALGAISWTQAALMLMVLLLVAVDFVWKSKPKGG